VRGQLATKPVVARLLRGARARARTLGVDLPYVSLDCIGGRFVKGSSGDLWGWPRGIPNPKRRVPDLATRPLTAQALSDPIDRKPHLLRPLAAQLSPPPLASIDPAERLVIDLSSLRTGDDFLQVLTSVLTVIARGEITPAEGVQIGKRVDARLRASRRLARLMRRTAIQTSPFRSRRIS